MLVTMPPSNNGTGLGTRGKLPQKPGDINPPSSCKHLVQKGRSRWPCTNTLGTRGIGGDTHFRNLLELASRKHRGMVFFPSTLGKKNSASIYKGQGGSLTLLPCRHLLRFLLALFYSDFPHTVIGEQHSPPALVLRGGGIVTV